MSSCNRMESTCCALFIRGVAALSGLHRIGLALRCGQQNGAPPRFPNSVFKDRTYRIAITYPGSFVASKYTKWQETSLRLERARAEWMSLFLPV